MTRSKFNKIIDDAIELEQKYMDKINEILQDEKILKTGGYQVEMLSEQYSRIGQYIGELKALKVSLDSTEANIEKVFALNNADMFDDEKEE